MGSLSYAEMSTVCEWQGGSSSGGERGWRRVENSTEQAEKCERIKLNTRKRCLKPKTWEGGSESSPCCFCASSLMHQFLKLPLSFGLPAGFCSYFKSPIWWLQGPSLTRLLQGCLNGSGWWGAWLGTRAASLPAVPAKLSCAALQT